MGANQYESNSVRVSRLEVLVQMASGKGRAVRHSSAQLLNIISPSTDFHRGEKNTLAQLTNCPAMQLVVLGYGRLLASGRNPEVCGSC